MIQKPYGIGGATASEIAASIEGAIRAERLRAAAALPPIRGLARALRVSPATVAASYRALQSRGILSAAARRGTRVSARPPILSRAADAVPSGLRNLAAGNPDPALLPDLRKYLDSLSTRPRLYGEPHNRRELIDLARAQFAADAIPARAIAVMGGALDAIERTLQAHLRAGDRVAVEDPGYFEIFDLIAALGMKTVAVPVDEYGMAPAALERALAGGAAACIMTPRAQNPTGAAHDQSRARMLRQLLDTHGEVLVIEDDHAGPIAGAPYFTVCHQRKQRWAVVRSVSKSLGPDLRLALVAGDAATISRIEGRQNVGAGWVSHILQELVEAMWRDGATREALEHAAREYTERRHAMIRGLNAYGIEARGRSGLNVWVPVGDEAGMVTNLAAAGWAVRAGERYRLASGPAVRISIATLAPSEASRLAEVFAQTLRPSRRTHLA
jgi:DNA-binding transcriptional MocR family regulator